MTIEGAMQDEELKKIPSLINQLTDDPVFVCERTGEDMRCVCSQILIKNYVPEQFVGIGIRCKRCGNVSWTPSLPDGEVLIHKTVSLGSGRIMGVTQVFMTNEDSLANGPDVAKEAQYTKPRIIDSKSNINVKELGEWESRLRALDPEKYDKQKRHFENSLCRFSPDIIMIWAFYTLRRAIQKGFLDFGRPEIRISISLFRLFADVLEIWHDHPRFAKVSRDLLKPKSFIHTCIVLACAAYMRNSGLHVGLSLENEVDTTSPDLYLRMTFEKKIYVEIKTPLALQWQVGQPECSFEAIYRTVKNVVKDCRFQINKLKPGVLGICCTLTSSGARETLLRAATELLNRKGKDFRGLAGIYCWCSMKTNGLTINHGEGYMTDFVPNKYYSGEFPVEGDYDNNHRDIFDGIMEVGNSMIDN